MDALGRHCIIEYYDCPTEVMNDLELIENTLTDAARQMGATIVASEFHRFNPFGISGMVIISESHLSIHTWPEYGYAAVDVFTCGDVIDPWVAHELMTERFKSGRQSVTEFRRGMMNVPRGTLPTAYGVTDPSKPAPETPTKPMHLRPSNQH